ncbi:MAG: hypothetical protein ACI841_004870 [Planctomycetota bacterium]|jgi:hypothetical protein
MMLQAMLLVTGAISAPSGFGTLTRISLPDDQKLDSAFRVAWETEAPSSLALIVEAREQGEEASVSTARRASRGPARELWLYVRNAQAPPFDNEPDYRVRLTSEVVAFGIGDLHPDDGDEIALMTARGVFLYRPRVEDERKRLSLLLRSQVLWQWPEQRVIDWSRAIRDIDGDGLEDLLLPTGIGYTVATQQRDGDVVSLQTQTLALPVLTGTLAAAVAVGRAEGDDPDAARRRRSRSGGGGRNEAPADEEGGSIAIGGDGGAPFSGLFSVTEEVPVPVLSDWDADGDLDLCVQTDKDLIVWLQQGGMFQRVPSLALPLPFIGDDDLLESDVSYSSHAGDLDQDGRLDSIVLVSDKDSDDARTQILIYRQQGRPNLYGEKGLPSGVLVLAGIGGFPRLVDVDTDGDLDLLVTSFRPDLLDALRSASTRRIEFELLVFRNDNGAFARKPWLSEELAVPIGGDNFRARFFGDISGDGKSELIVRDNKDHLQVRLVREKSGRLQVESRPLFELSIDEDAWLLIPDATAGVTGEFYVVEKDCITHVSFP